MTESVKPPTANQITAELLLRIPKAIPGALCWRQNSGKGIGWNQVRAMRALLQRGDVKGALEYLNRPMSFGLVGAPDIMIIFKSSQGRTLVGGVEVKAEHADGGADQQRLTQEAWQSRVCGLGGFYLLAEHITWDHGKPDVNKIIEELRSLV